MYNMIVHIWCGIGDQKLGIGLKSCHFMNSMNTMSMQLLHMTKKGHSLLHNLKGSFGIVNESLLGIKRDT